MVLGYVQGMKLDQSMDLEKKEWLWVKSDR